MTWKLIKPISADYSTKRDGVCLIDNKAIAKDSQALLIAEFKAGGGGKAQNWKVACATQSCQSKVEKWIEDNNTSNNTSNNSTGSTYQFGDERAATGLAVKEALETIREEFRKELERLNNRVKSLEKWEKQLKQKSDSKSNPARTPVDADSDGNYNVPSVCLGTKSDGTECKQSGAKITNPEYPGYCYQHRGQSGHVDPKPDDKPENTQPELITSGADLLAL